jgi:DNA-binding response OmpR family regulator
MRILIAEDNIFLLNIIKIRLEKDGHEIVAVGNGDLALTKIRDETFNMVITDLMMPFIGGLEILNTIKSYEKSIHVIILSGVNQSATIDEAYSLGADDFVTKPFSPNDLSARVKKLAAQNDYLKK